MMSLPAMIPLPNRLGRALSAAALLFLPPTASGFSAVWYVATNGLDANSGASNLVLNCDAYNNRGLDSGSLGNIDGFGAHPSSTNGGAMSFAAAARGSTAMTATIASTPRRW